MIRSDWVAVGLIVVLAAACSDDSASTKADSIPVAPRITAHGAAADHDVLLVTFDTTRVDRIGCYGFDGARTPNIDALAARGLRFTEIATVAPVTLPAHASLFTGDTPPIHGVRNNGSFQLDESAETLAERMAATGYRTAGFVGAAVLGRSFGLSQGFATYDDEMTAGHRGGAEAFPERDAKSVTDAALAWLDGTLESPERFFLWVHYFDPHFPYAPPTGFRDLGSAYDGEIASADAQLGRLIDRLRSKQRLERTLVVLTADHGEGLNQHHEPTHASLCYETTMHVPLVIAAPALERRVVEDRVGSLIDVMPTMLDLLGMEEAKNEGISLVGEVATDRAVYFETLVSRLDHGWAPLFGLRRRTDKLIHGPDPEYYDLAADREELTNLHGESAAARELDRLLRTRLAAHGNLEEVVEQADDLDPEVARQLAALGYVRTRQATGARGEGDPKKMIKLFARTEMAAKLVLAGRLKEAEKQIRFALNGDPGNGRAWGTAATIYRRQNRLDDAEACIKNSLRLLPAAVGQAFLAEIYLKRQDFAAAHTTLDAGLALDPKNGRIWMVRGALFAKQARLPEAIRAFEKALEVDPFTVGAEAKRAIASVRRAMRGN